MVNRYILIFSFLYVGHIGAHVNVVKSLPRDPQYYSSYLNSFSKWFNENIYAWDKVLNENEFGKIIAKQKHWFLHGDRKNKRGILWGIGFNSKTRNIFYSLRYHEIGNVDQFIIKRSDENGFCEEGLKSKGCPNQTSEISTKTFSSLPNGFPLSQNNRFIFQEFVTYQRSYFLKGEIVSVFFRLSNVQTEWLPKPLLAIIYKIGMETRLPLDKIEVSNNGDIIVYYP